MRFFLLLLIVFLLIDLHGVEPENLQAVEMFDGNTYYGTIATASKLDHIKVMMYFKGKQMGSKELPEIHVKEIRPASLKEVYDSLSFEKPPSPAVPILTTEILTEILTETVVRVPISDEYNELLSTDSELSSAIIERNREFKEIEERHTRELWEIKKRHKTARAAVLSWLIEYNIRGIDEYLQWYSIEPIPMITKDLVFDLSQNKEIYEKHLKLFWDTGYYKYDSRHGEMKNIPVLSILSYYYLHPQKISNISNAVLFIFNNHGALSLYVKLGMPNLLSDYNSHIIASQIWHLGLKDRSDIESYLLKNPTFLDLTNSH